MARSPCRRGATGVGAWLLLCLSGFGVACSENAAVAAGEGAAGGENAGSTEIDDGEAGGVSNMGGAANAAGSAGADTSGIGGAVDADGAANVADATNVDGSAGADVGAAGAGAGVAGTGPVPVEVDAGGEPATSAPPVAKEDIGDVVFDESQVHSYYLTLSDAEYAKLMDLSTLLLGPTIVNEDRNVEASLRIGDTELPSIAVRFKGQFSIWGCVDGPSGTRRVRVEPYFGDIDVCQRFSLKLDFNDYHEGARLDGLKQLNLHAMAADPSKMRERLGYSLYRDMGVLAPRAVHARVYINGEYHGLFAAVEEVDGRFTANRFPDSGDGNVFKELWPAAHITSADAEAALRTNEDPAELDVSDFLTFRDAVVAATEEDFATALEPYLDFDYLARYIVVNRAINDFDGVMAFYFGWGPPPANHNLFWYHDSESGQFVLVPWDLDKSLWTPEPNFWSNNAPHGDNVTPNWNVITNNCEGYTAWFDNLGQPYGMMAIDCDPLLRLLRGHIYDSQKAIIDEFIAGPFSEASVRAKLDAWRTQITRAVEEDPLMDSAHWESWVDALVADVPEFHRNSSLMMDGLIDE